MRAIALTGHPEAQNAVALQLTALITASAASLSVCIGVKTVAEAHVIHDGGGEIWHCGADEPDRALRGCIDRVITGSTFEEVAPHVINSFADFRTKTPIAA